MSGSILAATQVAVAAARSLAIGSSLFPDLDASRLLKDGSVIDAANCSRCTRDVSPVAAGCIGRPASKSGVPNAEKNLARREPTSTLAQTEVSSE